MAGLFGTKYEEYKTGFNSFNYWRYRDKGKEKTLAETEEYIKELDKKIEGYIKNNPNRPEWIKENLRFHQTTTEMTKEEILLLIGGPLNNIPTSEYGSNEKWVYRIYTGGWVCSEVQFYFKDNIVIKIFGFQTGNVL